MDLIVGRPQLAVDAREEPLLHRPLEGARPRDRCGHDPSSFAYSSMLNVCTWASDEALLVDHLRGELVLGHRPDREDRDEGSALVARSADPVDEVGGERGVERRRVVDDAIRKSGFACS